MPSGILPGDSIIPDLNPPGYYIPIKPKKSSSRVIIPTIASTVSWPNCYLEQGGWVFRQDDSGFSISATLYSLSAECFPRRGDLVAATGDCAVPQECCNYRVAEIEIEPLTSVGPCLCRVVAKPSITDYDKSASLLNERNAVMGVNSFKLYGSELQGAHLVSHHGEGIDWACRYVEATWHRRAGKHGEPPQDGLVNLPSWAGGGSDWRIYSATAEHVRDNDGETTLRRLRATFIKPCQGKWKSSGFNHLLFGDL